VTREPIRTWRSGCFRLDLFDTGRCDWRGQTRLAYSFRDKGKVIFEGEDFAGSPLHADDSNETVAALLSFLALRPGDTDRGYFDDYTPEQFAWAQQNGEELSLLAHELEEQPRLGMVSCTVETHFGAWVVAFDNGISLLLQTDYDKAAFAVSCGAIQAPADWDGLPSKLGTAWASFDPSIIDCCPDDYLDVAEPGEAS
jgi:hypothetical protein